jgi:rubrerythrin
MFPHIDEKDIARLLYGLSILEQSIFQFYKRLHEKVKYPLVKSLLLYVAYDSQKHSVILKELGENTANMEEKVDDCERELGVVWKTVVSLSKEISNEENMEDEKLLSLVNKLTDFENVIGEEYLTLVQLKSLEFILGICPR